MKKRYYNLILCIIGISVLVVAIILFTILIFIFKDFTFIDIFKYAIMAMLLLLCLNNLFAYVAFSEECLTYKKSLIGKQNIVEYTFFDKVIIDFQAVLGQDAYIYFKKSEKIILSFVARTDIVSDIIKNISKKKIVVFFDINSKWYNLPKKYHRLLYPYLSPKDKKAFEKKIGEEYIKYLIK